MKKIPYGIADFDRLIRQNYYYVDKTQYIKKMEDRGSFILFVRPRRMGKSLFTNMMMSYYDIAKRDQFQELFGNLWIGAHPTPWANSFFVLKFDFSHVEYDAENLKTNFGSYCNSQLISFFEHYNTYFSKEEIESVLSCDTAKSAVLRVVAVANLKNVPLYLFIDEYDNFTNQVLTARGVKAHEEITHGEGFYRDFFKALKGTVQRIYMTGVTPVSYDDLTSGFSIADAVALSPMFNQAIGVTETELREMIEYYRGEGVITRNTEDIIAEMKPWYDNFCFSEECYDVDPSVYNTDMVFHYIRDLVDFGRGPKDMIDYAARTDSNKLDYLVLSDDQKNKERRMEIVKEICANGYTTGEVRPQFRASAVGEEVNFKSMLYYYGTLTFGGWDEYGTPILQVPNKTMGDLYLSYMLREIDRTDSSIVSKRAVLDLCVRDAAVRGDWQPMVTEAAALYYQYASVRNSLGGEADIQGFLRGLLCLNQFFDLWPELELGSGFCDILLIPKGTPRCPTRFSYLLELKYMKTSDSDIKAHVAQACEQLNRYVADKHLTDSLLLRGTPLTKLYLVFRGTELVSYGEGY